MKNHVSFGPYKIYYIEYDKNGDEIGRGVYHTEYKYMGHAYARARKQYGDRKRFTYFVASRNPFREYYHEEVCDYCEKTYNRPENTEGLDIGFSLHYSDRRKPNGYGYVHKRMCYECADKIIDFLDSLTKERVTR